MKHLYNVRFQMDLGCMLDTWRLYGEVEEDGFEPRFVSTPKEFDRQTGIIKTASGKIYKIEQCATDREKIYDEIEAVIKRGGFSSH